MSAAAEGVVVDEGVNGGGDRASAGGESVSSGSDGRCAAGDRLSAKGDGVKSAGEGVHAARAGNSFEGWDLRPPSPSSLGDHEVPLLSNQLAGRRIALLVSGSIAALRSPDLARALRRRGAEVTAFCSPEALHYVGRQALEWATCRPLVTDLSWRAEHLSDDAPFDAWLLAPATYNSIGKLANGIADTVVTAALASALGRLGQGQTQVLVAPCLHGSLHNAVLERNCQTLRQMGVVLVPPRDAYGKHNLPEAEVLVAAVCRALASGSLRGRRLLVTGGPTPVPLDAVRRLVNRFKGQLASALAEELVLRGAEVQLLLGEGSTPPPSWLPHRLADSYDSYSQQVLEAVAGGLDAGLFSAAVADYRPVQTDDDKTASGQPRWTLELQPTAKVIEAVRQADPKLYMVTFKYLEHASVDELLEEARRRLIRYQLVVANRGAETRGHAQTAWLVSRSGCQQLEGKAAIAKGIADHLEQALPRWQGVS
ncbi:MAG: phosphopantothenoylcysteine decarboxylase [Synechococcaceae cyanobacterium]|jgi:phosphopantothenoylcysteine decarboxylase/phosphopantothenate--cysteine ligase